MAILQCEPNHRTPANRSGDSRLFGVEANGLSRRAERILFGSSWREHVDADTSNDAYIVFFKKSSGVNDNGFLPHETILAQNSRNPFNPSTMVRCEPPKAAFVSLKIYNALG
jgi:hypothetical protein